MNNHKNVRSSLFLIELILAILFFALGSAVCVQAFAKAYVMGESSRDLTFASSQASSAAAVIKYAGTDLAAVQQYFSYVIEEDGEFQIFYNQSYAECQPFEGIYILHISLDTNGRMLNTRIWITLKEDTKDTGILYELNLRYPIPVSG